MSQKLGGPLGVVPTPTFFGYATVMRLPSKESARNEIIEFIKFQRHTIMLFINFIFYCPRLILILYFLFLFICNFVWLCCLCRLHRKNSCFQSGYVQNNMLQWVGTDSGPCADGPPKGRTWFKFQVTVLENRIIQPIRMYLASRNDFNLSRSGTWNYLMGGLAVLREGQNTVSKVL